MSERLRSAFLMCLLAAALIAPEAWAEGSSPVRIAPATAKAAPVKNSTNYQSILSRVKDYSEIPSATALRGPEAEEASNGMSTYGLNVVNYSTSDNSRMVVRGGVPAGAGTAAAVQVQFIW